MTVVKDADVQSEVFPDSLTFSLNPSVFYKQEAVSSANEDALASCARSSSLSSRAVAGEQSRA